MLNLLQNLIIIVKSKYTVSHIKLSTLIIVFSLSLMTKAAFCQRAFDTLDIVNWNLEFFGDNANELPQEMTKVRTIMNNLNADIYALVEVVNTDSLASLVSSINGSYDYKVSQYATGASSPASGNYAGAQKLAFVYRNGMVRNITDRPLLKSSSSAHANWAFGRFPYFITAEVLGSDSVWQQVRFVVLHAKAYSDTESCDKRYYGGIEMKDTLDTYYANDKLIILGDYNDDFDMSICPTYSASNYSYLVNDSIDNNAYKSPTLPLSKMGVASTVSFPSFIDHVLLSNEMWPYYIAGSAEMLKAKVTNWVTSYSTYVSDHYPVRTKYRMTSPATTINALHNSYAVSVAPNPANSFVDVVCENENVLVQICSLDGKIILAQPAGRISLDNFSNGVYILVLSNKQGVFHHQQLVIIK